MRNWLDWLNSCTNFCEVSSLSLQKGEDEDNKISRTSVDIVLPVELNAVQFVGNFFLA